MAVRHGYGKIAGTDALVFAYDTGDARNSYRGEPTTNLVTNANFSNGATGWSYVGNGASYFETTTFQGRTVLHGNGVQYYNQTGYIRQAISVTSGATYTFSMRYYVVAGGLTLDPDDGWNGGGTFTSTGQWLTYTSTFTTTSTSIMLNLYGQNSVASYYYITDIQIEQKSHVTPFVAGTRSSTQGLLDLTGASTIDLANVSFDSNAQITFDGTNDTLDTGIALTDLPALSNFTIECIAKIDAYPSAASPNFYNNTTKCGVLVGAAYYSGTALYWYGNSSGTACTIYAYIRGADAYRTAGGFDLTPGKYHHLVLVNDSTNSILRLYANGTLNGSATTATQQYNSGLAASAGNIGISKPQVDGGGEAVYSYFDGDVPTTKIYNRALTADEVRNNYRHYKTRFSI